MENYKVKDLIDNAIKASKEKYEKWVHEQELIWNKDVNHIPCYNTNTEVILFSGTGRECSIIYDELDKELYNRAITLYCDKAFPMDDIESIKPTLDNAKMYNIWLIYNTSSGYTYGINQI